MNSIRFGSVFGQAESCVLAISGSPAWVSDLEWVAYVDVS